MHLEGESRIRSPLDRVSRFLLDSRELLSCLEDRHRFTPVDAQHFEGEVTSGIGFLQGTFHVTGTYVMREAPSSLVILLHGRGLGTTLGAEVRIDLSEVDGFTTLRWRAETTLAGPVASLGERLFRGTVESKAVGFFENLRRRLEGGEPFGPPTPSSPGLGTPTDSPGGTPGRTSLNDAGLGVESIPRDRRSAALTPEVFTVRAMGRESRVPETRSPTPSKLPQPSGNGSSFIARGGRAATVRCRLHS
jgi:carbon monoxide dehydrogenase subunit G